MDRKDSFLLTECEHLRKEIEILSTETRTLARYSLVIAGAVYGWIAARLLDPKVHGLDPQFRVLAWVPGAVVLVFALRSLALTHGIKRNAKYIRLVETEFLSDDGLGWESHLERTRKRFIFWSATLYWVVLFLATLVAPFLLPFG